MGEKGIGKTVAIQTALHHYCGVVNLTVNPQTSEHLMFKVQFKLLGGITAYFLNFMLEKSFSGLLFWHYSLIRRPPIIVIQIFEGIPNKEALLAIIRDVCFY